MTSRSSHRSGIVSPKHQSASPLTFSLQLPFILLAANTKNTLGNSLNDQSTSPNTDHLLRIQGVLENFIKGIRFAVWIPESPTNSVNRQIRVLRSEADRDQLKRDKKAAQKSWRAAEKQRWTQFSQQRKWILRNPPTSEEEVSNSCGLLGPWKCGDALLSHHELKAVGTQTQCFPFLLQRFGVNVNQVERFEREVHDIFRVLRSLNGLKDKDGDSIRIVIGERCWPCVEYTAPRDGLERRGRPSISGNTFFSPISRALSPVSEMDGTFSPIRRALSPASRFMGSVGGGLSTWGGTVENEREPSEWDEDKVANVLAVWIIFEREILSLSAVDVIHTYWPLSHSLTYNAVEELRLEKKMLMKSVMAKMRKAEKQAGKGEGDGGSKERRRAELEKAYKEWVQRLRWEDEDDQESERVLAQARKDWWEEVEQVGIGNIIQRVRKLENGGQRVGISFTMAEEEPAAESESDPDLAPASLFENTHELSNNKHDADLHVSGLSFPIPVQTLSPEPLLAYLSFLNQLLIFATEKTPDAIAHHVTTLRDRTSVRKLSFSRNFKRVAMMVDMKKEDVQELMKLVAGEKREGSDGGKAEEHDFFERIVTLVKARRDKGRAGMEYWLRRYEDSGGFVMPRRLELLGLVERSSTARTRDKNVGRS